jgi:hypothetical protein
MSFIFVEEFIDIEVFSVAVKSLERGAVVFGNLSASEIYFLFLFLFEKMFAILGPLSRKEAGSGGRRHPP